MIESGAHNFDFGADRFGFRDLAAINWSLGAPQLYEHALQRNEARIAAHGALVADTGAHTGRSPKDKFVVRDDNTEASVWWDNNNAMTVEHFDTLVADFIAHAKGKTLFCSGSLRWRRRGVPAAHARLHRIRLAFAVHPQPPDPAAGGGSQRLCPGSDDRRSALVPRRPQAAWRAQRNDHRLRLQAQDRAHRRHELCGRDEEIGVHRPQLSVAAKTSDADALLGQHWPGRRRCDLFRPLRHRQDHALRRSPPRADRRRRTWVGPRRNIQFRGRLLRQGDQAVARGGAGDLCDDRTFRNRYGERDARSYLEDSRTSTTIPGPRIPASPTRSISWPTLRRPAAPVIPRTSSC